MSRTTRWSGAIVAAFALLLTLAQAQTAEALIKPKPTPWFAGFHIQPTIGLKGSKSVAGVSTKYAAYPQLGFSFGYDVFPKLGLSVRGEFDLGFVLKAKACTPFGCAVGDIANGSIKIIELNVVWAFNMGFFKFPLYLAPELGLGAFIATHKDFKNTQAGMNIKPGFAVSYLVMRNLELRMTPFRINLAVPFTKNFKDVYGVLVNYEFVFAVRGRW